MRSERKPMTIVFYCTEPQALNIENLFDVAANGTAANMVLISHGLASLGHRVYVLNRSVTGCFGGVNHIHTASEDACRTQLRELGKIDVFVANGWAASIFLGGDVIAAGRRIYWLQNYIDIARFEDAIQAGRLDNVFCVSDAHLGAFWRSRFFSRFRMFYNTVSTGKIQAFPIAGPRKDVIIFAGALREVKGYYDAIRIFRVFSQRNPNYKLCLAGSAALHGRPEESNDFCKDLVSAGKVEFLGNLGRKHLYRLFAEAKLCLVNPSWTSEPETFGVAAIEAQALGCPVISTYRGGLPETVADGRSGILVKSREDMGLVRAMEQLITSAEQWQRYSDYGRAFVLEKFDSRKMARSCSDELYRIMGNPAGATGARYSRILLKKLSDRFGSVVRTRTNGYVKA